MDTTAIYPNRIKDKKKVEKMFNLNEFGNNETMFYTKKGNLFAIGYIRIVYGDHGPYIEFDKSNIKIELKSKFNKPCKSYHYYEWLIPIDGSDVKAYDQKRDVKNLHYAPKGGYKEYREEGYADYKIGMIYVSPYDLRTLVSF